MCLGGWIIRRDESRRYVALTFDRCCKINILTSQPSNILTTQPSMRLIKIFHNFQHQHNIEIKLSDEIKVNIGGKDAGLQ